MRQLQNNFRRSIQMQHAFDMAKQPQMQSKIVKTPPPSPKEEKIESIIEETKPEIKLEETLKKSETKPTENKINRLPNLDK